MSNMQKYARWLALVRRHKTKKQDAAPPEHQTEQKQSHEYSGLWDVGKEPGDLIQFVYLCLLRVETLLISAHLERIFFSRDITGRHLHLIVSWWQFIPLTCVNAP